MVHVCVPSASAPCFEVLTPILASAYSLTRIPLRNTLVVICVEEDLPITVSSNAFVTRCRPVS
jgi:hypothetical protein